ncbi:conserved protein, unknown function, partial [Hepatocystis sp. ex Piliocolobus tephrosceles]
LVEALAYILYQCTDRSYYVVAFLLPECYDYEYYINKTQINDTNNNIIRDLKKINIYYKEFNSIKDVINFYLEHFIIFSSSTGVISFLYSSSSNTIGSNNEHNNVNLHLNYTSDINYSPDENYSQGCSLQKLPLYNTTTSNNITTADSNTDSSNIILKGINKRPLIGLLTDFEAFKYCEVGNFYKYPIYPIWVVSSSNHYTLLFSLNIHNSKCTSEEYFLTKLNKSWNKYDQENNKYILSQFIPQLIEDLNLKEEYKLMFNGFANDIDVLLYSEFKSFYLQLNQKDINDLKTYDPPKEKYFYLYDAQESPERSIKYFLLKEVDYDVSYDHYLKFFNTRWPNNTVEVLHKNTKKGTRHKFEG